MHTGDHRKTSDELRDHPELQQVLGHRLTEDLAAVDLALGPQDRVEPHALLSGTVLDDLLQTREGTTADEQHVRGVDLDELLVGMLTPALWRHARRGALQDLQQRLLNALTGHVPGDRRVLTLTRDLVDLVDVDDSGLGLLDVIVGGLDQLQQNVLDVLAHVTRLGQHGGVGDRERNVQDLGKGLGQQGLARTGGAQEQDVGLGDLHFLVAGTLLTVGTDPLVVVVDRYGQGLLRPVLTDDVGVQELVDLPGLGK